MKLYKVFTFALLLSLSSSVCLAQKEGFGIPNRLLSDRQIFHFGFLIGYNLYDFNIKTKAHFTEYDSLLIVNTSPLSGFNLGIVTDLKIGNYFNLRFIPGLAFADRIVNYTIRYSTWQEFVTQKNVESVYVELPLVFKFKSSRMHNVRVYVIAGAQYSLDLISAAKKQANNPQEIILKLYPHDFQGQAGVGLDFYCTYFKFTTEFKMGFGLRNLLKQENNIYASNITHLKSKIMQISFFFE